RWLSARSKMAEISRHLAGTIELKSQYRSSLSFRSVPHHARTAANPISSRRSIGTVVRYGERPSGLSYRRSVPLLLLGVWSGTISKLLRLSTRRGSRIWMTVPLLATILVRRAIRTPPFAACDSSLVAGSGRARTHLLGTKDGSTALQREKTTRN